MSQQVVLTDTYVYVEELDVPWSECPGCDICEGNYPLHGLYNLGCDRFLGGVREVVEDIESCSLWYRRFRPLWRDVAAQMREVR